MSETKASAEQLVTLGRIGKSHGTKGWLRLISFTDPVTNIAEYRHFIACLRDRQETLEMDQCRPQGSVLIAHFLGYDDPESAQALVGAELQVAVSELPVLDENQYYWHQLIGLRVVNCHGEVLGKVAALMETGANDVLVVHPDSTSIDAHERLIPYLRDSVVKEVDLEEGRLVVDWSADYLV
jgi:16S rRNA processing protein RimM